MEVDCALGVLDGLRQLIEVEVLKAVANKQPPSVLEDQLLARGPLPFFPGKCCFRNRHDLQLPDSDSKSNYFSKSLFILHRLHPSLIIQIPPHGLADAALERI